MQTVNPGQTTTVVESGLPTGAIVCFQVVNAVTGAVAIARTGAGVIEQPLGSGAFVIHFVAPVQGDLYLVVVDWSNGVLDPATTRVSELRVTLEVQPGSSGIGAIGDYVKMHMGGETWKGLTTDPDYGEPFVARAIDLVKRRAFTIPPDTAGEDALDPRILNYLGILASLQLIAAARDYWGSQYISTSQGDDPSEMITYTNRAKLMDNLRDDLMRALPEAEADAVPIIDQPVLRSRSIPEIDEYDDYKSTADPRAFPNPQDFPGVDGQPVDAFGYPRRQSGVEL